MVGPGDLRGSRGPDRATRGAPLEGRTDPRARFAVRNRRPAAGDVDVVPHLAWVTSVGGHQDLARVLRFFVENRVESPRGVTERKAHEYGLAVLAYRYLDRLVPEADREIMRRALRAWLHEDREVARIWAKSLTSPEAERLFARFESHRLGELGRDLEALVREDARDL